MRGVWERRHKRDRCSCLGERERKTKRQKEAKGRETKGRREADGQMSDDCPASIERMKGEKQRTKYNSDCCCIILCSGIKHTHTHTLTGC